MRDNAEREGVWSMSVCNPSISQTRELGIIFLSMLIGSGSEDHVISFADWKRLGELSLNLSHVRLHSATGWFGDQPVMFTALVAARATRSLCSAPKLLCAGYGFELKPTH